MPKLPKITLPGGDKRSRRTDKPEPRRAAQGAQYLAELKRQGVLLFRGLVGLGPKAFDLLRTAEDKFTVKTSKEGDEKKTAPDTTVLDLLLRLSEAVGTDSGYARILRGASIVFARSGFESARIEDILAAAKVSPRTYYQFFRNKNEVLEAIFDLFISVWIEVAESELAHEGDAWKKLERLARTYVGAIATVGPLGRVLISEALRPHTATEKRRNEAHERLVELLAPVFTQLWKSEADPARIRARLAAVDGLLLELRVDARSSPDALYRAGIMLYEILAATGPQVS